MKMRNVALNKISQTILDLMLIMKSNVFVWFSFI